MYLTDYSLDELKELLAAAGEPAFRARQIREWIMRGVPVQGMTNLPQRLRDLLSGIPYGSVTVQEKRVSDRDGTAKYLLALEDGNLVEGVLMRYHYGNTACISTQVGCNMGCRFCASTLSGCVRSLHSGEMLGEILAIEKNEPVPEGMHRVVTNIVLMGIGEPMDNYDNVIRFLRDVTAQDGLRISPRNISVSTCGIVPKMKTFLTDAPHVTLSVSLHAHDDDTRSSIMPVNRVYPIRDVIEAAREYAEVTGRRVVFEYALIDGVNASDEDARALSRLLKGILCHVNLIPLNPVPERNLRGVTRTRAAEFCALLNRLGTSATVRREMGTDIEGACGQLRKSHMDLRG